MERQRELVGLPLEHGTDPNQTSHSPQGRRSHSIQQLLLEHGATDDLPMNVEMERSWARDSGHGQMTEYSGLRLNAGGRLTTPSHVNNEV